MAVWCTVAVVLSTSDLPEDCALGLRGRNNTETTEQWTVMTPTLGQLLSVRVLLMVVPRVLPQL